MPNFHRPSLRITIFEVSPPAPDTLVIPILRKWRDTSLGSIPDKLTTWRRVDVACIYDHTRIISLSKYADISALSDNVLL